VSRRPFEDELEQLRLQVELMALLVGSAFDRAHAVLADGDIAAAGELLDGDDEIDAMHVSLTERCYQLLVREAPRASDLRLVVSVIRALTALERIGDLCLRIAKTVDDQPLLARHPAVFAVLLELSANVRARYRVVQEAWAANSVEPLERLAQTDPLDDFAEVLMGRILDLEGADAVRVAVAAFVVGRSLDRIGDHTRILAFRLQYLLTGDPTFLADEVM
jgi:phosphate transport system protein